MKDLIEAAVSAAGRTGMQAAVILIGHSEGVAFPAGERQTSAAPPAQVDNSNITVQADQVSHLRNLTAERDELRLHAVRLEAQVKHLETAVAQGGAGNLAEGLSQANAAAEKFQSQVVQLQDQLAAAQAEVSALKAGGATPSENVPQADQVAHIRAVAVDQLGLDEKVAKAAAKAGIVNYGDLFDVYTAGELKEKVGRSMTKDKLAEVGIVLLRQGVPRGDGAAAAALSTGGASDVPAGFEDRGWLDRLNAARSKEVRLKGVDAKVLELKAAAQTAHPGALVNGELDLEKLPDAAGNEIRIEENTFNVVRGQLIAMLWSCNLEASIASQAAPGTAVDECLRVAGLESLCEPQEEPAAAAPAEATA